MQQAVRHLLSRSVVLREFRSVFFTGRQAISGGKKTPLTKWPQKLDRQFRRGKIVKFSSVSFLHRSRLRLCGVRTLLTTRLLRTTQQHRPFPAVVVGVAVVVVGVVVVVGGCCSYHHSAVGGRAAARTPDSCGSCCRRLQRRHGTLPSWDWKFCQPALLVALLRLSVVGDGATLRSEKKRNSKKKKNK